MIAAPSLVIQPREGESPPPGGRQYGHFLALEVLQPAKNILLSRGTVTTESGGTISGFYGVYANSTISVVNDGVIADECACRSGEPGFTKRAPEQPLATPRSDQIFWSVTAIVSRVVMIFILTRE